NDDRVVGLVQRPRITGLDPDHLRPLDEALRAQEADRELVLVARRAHRHGHGHRLLVRPGGPDLEWLLADNTIGADLDPVAAYGDDPRRCHVTSRRRDL